VTDPDAGQAVFNAGTINDGVYGSLTIDAAGNWTYTLNNADPAVQVLKEGESIVRPITVTSADGTTHVITVTIQGTNETATLGSGTVQEDTTLTADGTLVATGVATFVPSTQAGTYGSLTVDAAGHWVYTLNNADPVVQALVTGETKVETFTVTLDDGATTTVTINVLGLDDGAIIVPHTPGADAGTVKEDVTLTVSGKLDVTDPDAGQAVFNAGTINDGVYGSLTIDAAGNWTYTLNNADPAVQGLKEGETVIRPITVTSADGTTHIVTVTILGTNDVPTARNDNAQTLEDTPLTLSTGTLLVNDTDPDGDPLTVISVQDPTHGTVTLVGGNIIFTPDPDYNGPASFTYTISDGQGGTSTATVNIHVIPVNDAPTTCGGMVTGIEDTPLILHWGDFNASDIDTPASGLSIVVGSLPADGLLQYKDGGGNWVSAAVGQVFSKSFIDSGNLRFLPTLNESGSDDFGGNGVGNKEADYARFNYTVYDGELSSNVGTMRIDITPVADTPQLSLEATTSTTHVTDFQNITLPDNPGWTPNVKASDMISFGTSTWQTDNPGGLLEVGYQHIYLGGAQSTNKVIELERNAGDPANLYTDLQAQTGDIFQLAFDYSSRMQSSSLINVYWEGQLIKVLNSDTPGFQHFTLNLVATQDGTSRLEFRAGNSDSYGGVLDGISLGKVDDNIGLQDQWIHLSKISAQLTDTDGSETLAVSIKDIPVGAQLTDGTHTFTATAGATSVDVTNWSLDSLQLKPPAGFVGDLQLQVSATATETANGDQATASNVIDVTVLLNNQPPTVGSQSLTALEGVPSHLIIDIPTDPNGDALTVTVTTLPTTGQILTDGGTAVQVGDTLSIHQLTSLQYISPTDIVGTQAAGSFGYAVSDGYNTVHDSLTIQVVDNPAIIHGRDGNDQITVAYGEVGDGTTVYAQYGAYVDGSGVPHAAEGPVVINTTGTAQVFDAGGGNDYVEGGAGNDVIYLGDSGGTAGTVNEDLGLKFVLNDGLMTTADHLVTQASDGMLSAAAKTSQPVADLANGGSGDDIIFGGGGTDLIYGGAGDDVLYGGAQSDGLRGGAGNDTLIGGPGSDALRGDLGNDVFKWTLGDQQATPGATALGGGNYLHLPSSVNVAKGATDVVMDFNMSTADGDNDKLDLRDLLQGELHSDGNIGNLTNYLRLETVPNTGGGGSSTVIHISHDGGFSGGYNLAAEDQTIVLQNVDLGANDTTNAAVIQDLLNKGKLVTD
ncbi:VCBS domain-containing protein, partial [Chitiniphilus shinanonensis]|uniref:VCBS domain-containing protein n=4 Tax=Chitiniphilus shinanonensis TaxID=553088 RepID=UPI00333E5075